MLLDHVPGADLFGASLEVRLTIAEEAHAIALSTVDAVDDLVALGAPDARREALYRDICQAAQPALAGDPRLAALIDGLDDRLRAVEECGLPDVLVHGDLHPGNVRADGAGPHTIIDWGDACIGNPGFDVLRLTERLEPDQAEPVLAAWVDRWRSAVPGCDPQRAVELLRPVAALRGAAVYAAFLRNIEATEHPYHAGDVPDCLSRAVDLAG
jgi:aminoglycoside phosphotransferase (APT) family kinase protein